MVQLLVLMVALAGPPVVRLEGAGKVRGVHTAVGREGAYFLSLPYKSQQG
jgi:hypothetical protein